MTRARTMRDDGRVPQMAWLDTAQRQLSTMLGRRVYLGPDGGNGYSTMRVEQRCTACRAEISVALENPVRFGHRIEEETINLWKVAGSVARHAYLKHACSPPADDCQLAGLSSAELCELAQEIERQGTKAVERSIEIMNLSRER